MYLKRGKKVFIPFKSEGTFRYIPKEKNKVFHPFKSNSGGAYGIRAVI